jgi:hypothetical protein
MEMFEMFALFSVVRLIPAERLGKLLYKEVPSEKAF